MQPQENLCFHHNYANLYGCSSLDVVKTFPAAFGAGKGGITTYRTRIQRILRIGTDLTKIRLDPINPRHPRSNTTYRTRIQRIARIGTDLTKVRLNPMNPRHLRSNTTYRTRIQRITRIGTDLLKIRLNPPNPRHPRSNTTYRTRIQRIARIGTDLLKICFAVVGTADEDTRHEAIAFAPACVGLVVWADSWWG